MSNVQVVANIEQLSRMAAEILINLAVAATQTNGVFTVALAGGSTPKRLYTLLGDAREPFMDLLPWQKIHFFFGDERHVAPDHPDSNYRMVLEAMLGQVPLPKENVHRIKSEIGDPGNVSDEYEQDLREFFALSQGELPRFDLVLLGMGSDGHTASIFPGSDVINEKTRLVVATWVNKLNAYRITLTPRVLNNAAFILLLVSGKEKAETLREVLQGPYQPELFPVQLIKPEKGELLWLVDLEAASQLEKDNKGQ